MEKKSKNLKTLEQIRKEQGKTHWAKLIVEEKSTSKLSVPKKPKTK
jgi:hypothetical protein